MLQVGLVGVGGISRDQHLPGWLKVPFVKVVALADISQEALKAGAKQVPDARCFSDWKDLVALPNLDIVDICTPNRTHAPIAIAALSAGKHVLCEKPLAVTSAEVMGMRDAALQSKRLLMAAQHYRFDNSCRQLKAMIAAGQLGDIYYSRAQWLRRRMLPPRPTFIQKNLSGGGAALDLGVHVLDLAYWFMGSPKPVRVSAQVETKLAHRHDLGSSWGDWDRDRIDVEDFTAAFIRFDNGATMTLETSWLAFQPDNETIRLQCYGTKGGLVWPEGILVGETNRVPWDMKLAEVAKNNAHHDEILQFASAVRDGKASPIPVEESLQVIRILEGIYKSGLEKREVEL